MPLWDDAGYITANPDIRTLHGDSINYSLKKTFTGYVMGNYHPLTMLSYSIEYNRFKLDPFPYHVTNLVLHILNSLLVLLFIRLLTKQKWVSFITALLFAIHPMHVESVAWVSERKDVLFSFFYLAALCSYVLSATDKKTKWYLYPLTLLFFILSLLSKGTAVTLPLAFFAVDYFLGVKINFKNILSKIPFFILALIFGYIAILAQKTASAIHISDYSYFDRLLFSCYALVLYLFRLIVPVNLSCVYNYPVKHHGLYPVWVYVSPFILLILSYLIYRFRKSGKEFMFGFGFFIITIILVLQLLPVGGVIMADRYTYLPYIGMFFIAGRELNHFFSVKSKGLKAYKTLTVIIFSVIVIVFCYLTYNRTKVWHDNVSLWNNVISNSGKESVNYKCRGDAYLEAKQYDQAIRDYDYSIQLSNKDYQVYYCRGLTYYTMGQYDKATADFTSVLSMNPSLAKALHGRGLSYAGMNNYEKAIEDYTSALKHDTTFIKAYYDRGLANENLKRYKEAIADYTAAIKYNKNHSEAYNNRGISYAHTGELDKALNDFNSARTVNPQNINAYNNLGNTYFSLNDFKNAIRAYTSTIQLSPQFGSAYINRSIAYSRIEQYDLAYQDAIKAKELGHPMDPDYIERLLKSMKKRKTK